MGGGIYIFIGAALGVLLTAFGVAFIADRLLARHHRNSSTANDWREQCSDCDERFIQILNNHDRPYADWSQRNHG